MCEQRNIFFSLLKKFSIVHTIFHSVGKSNRKGVGISGFQPLWQVHFVTTSNIFWGLFFWLGSKACRQNVPTTGLEFSSLWFFARLELLPAMLHNIKPKKQLGYVGGLNPSSSSFFDEESPRTNRSLTWKDSFSYLAPFISFYSRKNEGKTTSKEVCIFVPLWLSR